MQFLKIDKSEWLWQKIPLNPKAQTGNEKKVWCFQFDGHYKTDAYSDFVLWHQQNNNSLSMYRHKLVWKCQQNIDKVCTVKTSLDLTDFDEAHGEADCSASVRVREDSNTSFER